MSNYRDFVEDFPRRCRDVLVLCSGEARLQDREVTLLLMATTAGFVMPFERLSEGESIIQPTLDRPIFSSAMSRLIDELAKESGQSHLFNGAGWRGGSLKSVVGTPDDWDECIAPERLGQDTPVWEAIRRLRNGLAHGNVFSRPGPHGRIEDLVFVSGGIRKNGTKIPSRFLVLSPVELREFMDRWFTFVADLHVPHAAVVDLLERLPEGTYPPKPAGGGEGRWHDRDTLPPQLSRHL